MDSDFLPKPDNVNVEFKKPVSWLVGRDLIAGLKWIALYTAFKGKLDPRDWMKPQVFRYKEPATALNFWRKRSEREWRWKIKNDKFWQQYEAAHPDFWKAGEGTETEEFWFDYIADSGDGQMATYNVAYMCLSDMWADGSLKTAANPSLPAVAADAEVRLEMTNKYNTLLPRGQFLFVGGDTAYHIADYSTLSERFQHPFRWAFTSLRKFLQDQNRLRETPDKEGHIPLKDAAGKILRTDSEPPRPIFAVPGNHDYYDVIDGFNRQFRRPATPEHGRKLARPQLSLPGFERYQDASYIALHLPFNWWFLGLDTEISELDLRQQVFFFNIKNRQTGQLPDKLIIATPEPTTVFRQCKPEDDKTLQAFKQLGVARQFLECAPPEVTPPLKCRLDLSGDVHHYARYYGPNTKQLTNSRLHADNYASVVAGGGGAFHHPTTTRADKGIEEQVLYPPPDVSRDAVAPRVFDLRNIWHGGYVWLFGMIITAIIYFAATIPPSSKEAVDWLFAALHRLPFVPEDTLPWFRKPARVALFEPINYWLSTLLLLASFAPLLWAIMRLDRFVKQLILVPVVWGEKESPPVDVKQLPIRYHDLIPIGVALLATLALYILGIWKYVIDARELHPFSCSLIVLYHLALAVGIAVLCVQNSEWLTHRVKFIMGTKYDYIPMSIALSLAALIGLFGVWMFGYHAAAYVLSDIIFSLVVLGLLVALVAVAVTVAGKLQNTPGRILMAVLGLWHAVLHLAVPLLLVRLGDWRAILLTLVVVFIFSGVAPPFTRISVPGIGVFLMRWKSPIARWLLTLAWIVYGGVILLLPVWFHERAQVRISDGGGSYFYSSFLPQAWVDAIAGFYAARGIEGIWTAVTLMLISLAVAIALAFLLSMAWLSWYFAVSLGFNAHNNEVGGAARIEEYKHMVRIRLRKNDLTAFVIAIDDPEVEGRNLKPKLIDVFQLKA